MSVFGAGKGLPTKLAKEPLIEAVFEMRFESSAPVAAMLPGFLYSQLGGFDNIEQLPVQAMPKEIRDADPNFLHAPLTKCSWGNYWVLVGDRVFSIASKLPYAGWEDFREKIIAAFGAVLNAKMISTIDRCSIKYVDILDSIPLEASKCFNMDLAVGGRAGLNNFHVKAAMVDGDIHHTVQLVSNAVTQLYTGDSLQGPVIDVDSMIKIASEDTSIFLSKLADRAEQLHESNKRMIFESISESALTYLEPSYD